LTTGLENFNNKLTVSEYLINFSCVFLLLIKKQMRMKTLKFFLITALMSLTSLSFSSIAPAYGSSTGTANPQLTIKITLQDALLNSQLTMAIHQQVDPALLKHDPNKVFAAHVLFRHIVYHVYGTYGEWLSFFSANPGTPGNQ
jgi:hypothetical protein